MRLAIISFLALDITRNGYYYGGPSIVARVVICCWKLLTPSCPLVDVLLSNPHQRKGRRKVHGHWQIQRLKRACLFSTVKRVAFTMTSNYVFFFTIVGGGFSGHLIKQHFAKFERIFFPFKSHDMTWRGNATFLKKRALVGTETMARGQRIQILFLLLISQKQI